jgi:peptidoglycan/xylan/chitin deacetylase (PgdA/CDA1 family)
MFPASFCQFPSWHHRISLRGWYGALGLLALTGFLKFKREIPSTGGAASPNEVSRGPQGHRLVALTFDAGVEVTALPELLKALQSSKTTCTFFLTGQWAAKNPKAARQIVSGEHQIGNHTWSHPDLTLLDDASIQSEILRAEALLTKLAGISPRPFLCAPYGARDDRVLSAARHVGYTSIYWTLDSLDSVEPPKTPQFLFDRISAVRDQDLNGAIILMHVGEPSTARALPIILTHLKKRGFKVVTVSILLGLTLTRDYHRTKFDVHSGE